MVNWLLQTLSNFYLRWEGLGLKVTFVLVSLQVLHLFWLTTFVVFNDPSYTLYIPPIVFVVIDYIEIPALVSGVVFYSISFAARQKKMDLVYMSLLLVQGVHILWITDAFIYMSFQFNQMTWLAWFAVGIDYLELAVVFDLYKRIRNR